ncbi:cupin domain-containing protein [Pseudonocardia bannensis]|uniref:Cupin domain-containing protein n=1 Tax=Pseudonocardia bannensis TaxID=630973 RepID=A0A848DBE5_9PSEU|nr:cupin domain-containing protein [Pseudonocardia bannensis]NMH90080.1 cupin domain-containing protein [Pseudonocardia bannensis]
MAFDVKKVVTDRTAEGRSVFAEETSVEPGPVLGLDIYNIWGTDDGIPFVGAGDNPATVPYPFFPGPGGTRFVVVRFPPESAEQEEPDGADPEEIAADAERRQPGLIGVFEPDTPGMHTTDSIDYGICVDGEIYLELDDGAEVHVTPGTCVVQRGTRHAWRNRSDRHCTMVYVLVGADRKSG